MKPKLIRSSSEELLLQEKEVISKMRKFDEDDAKLIYDFEADKYYIYGSGSVEHTTVDSLLDKRLIYSDGRGWNNTWLYELTEKGKTIEI